jgi:DNA-binding MarR family transcriptional regulator
MPRHRALFPKRLRSHSRNATCVYAPLPRPASSSLSIRMESLGFQSIDEKLKGVLSVLRRPMRHAGSRIDNLLVDPSSFDSCCVRGGEGHCPRMPPNPTTRGKAARQRAFHEWHVDATAFLYEVVRTADALREAKAFDGEPALHYGARWQVLRAIERCGGAPSFSGLARALQVSRQTAREHAIKAARVGVVELLPAPEDRRVVQVALTPAGRKELEARRMPPLSWVGAVLNGLEPEAMRSTQHVLRVLRLRLEGQAREMRRAAPRAG